MRRIARALAILMSTATLAACSGDGGGSLVPPADVAAPPVAPPPVVPASVLPGMSSAVVEADAETIAEEAVHVDRVKELLGDAGFVSASQRSFQGGSGAFSRVFVRTMVFQEPTGVSSYLAWFRANAGREIVTAKEIAPSGLPPDAIAFRHVPGGCCRRDFPVFLAAWPRGTSVVFVHGGGPKVTTAALVDLVAAVDERIGQAGV